jgi:hypothetical protein
MSIYRCDANDVNLRIEQKRRQVYNISQIFSKMALEIWLAFFCKEINHDPTTSYYDRRTLLPVTANGNFSVMMRNILAYCKSQRTFSSYSNMPVRSIEEPDSPLLLQISHFCELCYTSAKYTVHSIGPEADNSDNIFSARGSTLPGSQTSMNTFSGPRYPFDRTELPGIHPRKRSFRFSLQEF